MAKKTKTEVDSLTIRVSRDLCAAIDSSAVKPRESRDSILRRIFRLPAKKHWSKR